MMDFTQGPETDLFLLPVFMRGVIGIAENNGMGSQFVQLLRQYQAMIETKIKEREASEKSI